MDRVRTGDVQSSFRVIDRYDDYARLAAQEHLPDRMNVTSYDVNPERHLTDLEGLAVVLEESGL
jgi:hypothetical protein